MPVHLAGVRGPLYGPDLLPGPRMDVHTVPPRDLRPVRGATGKASKFLQDARVLADAVQG